MSSTSPKEDKSPEYRGRAHVEGENLYFGEAEQDGRNSTSPTHSSKPQHKKVKDMQESGCQNDLFSKSLERATESSDVLKPGSSALLGSKLKSEGGGFTVERELQLAEKHISDLTEQLKSAREELLQANEREKRLLDKQKRLEEELAIKTGDLSEALSKLRRTEAELWELKETHKVVSEERKPEIDEEIRNPLLLYDSMDNKWGFLGRESGGTEISECFPATMPALEFKFSTPKARRQEVITLDQPKLTAELLRSLNQVETNEKTRPISTISTCSPLSGLPNDPRFEWAGTPRLDEECNSVECLDEPSTKLVVPKRHWEKLHREGRSRVHFSPVRSSKISNEELCSIESKEIKITTASTYVAKNYSFGEYKTDRERFNILPKVDGYKSEMWMSIIDTPRSRSTRLRKRSKTVSDSKSFSYLRYASESPRFSEECVNLGNDLQGDVGFLKAEIQSLRAINKNTEENFWVKYEKCMKKLFTQESRSAALEEELKKKDDRLNQITNELVMIRAKMAEYKAAGMQIPSIDLSIAASVASFTLFTNLGHNQSLRTRRSSNSFGKFLQKGLEDELEMDSGNKEEALEPKNSKNISLNEVQNLRHTCRKRGALIVKLKSELNALMNGDELSYEQDRRKHGSQLIEVIRKIENKHKQLFVFFHKHSVKMKGMLQSLQKSTMEVKWHVAETTSEQYFQQYSIKSRSVKQCVTNLCDRMCEYPVSVSQYQMNLNESTKEALQMCRYLNFVWSSSKSKSPRNFDPKDQNKRWKSGNTQLSKTLSNLESTPNLSGLRMFSSPKWAMTHKFPVRKKPNYAYEEAWCIFDSDDADSERSLRLNKRFDNHRAYRPMGRKRDHKEKTIQTSPRKYRTKHADKSSFSAISRYDTDDSRVFRQSSAKSILKTSSMRADEESVVRSDFPRWAYNEVSKESGRKCYSDRNSYARSSSESLMGEMV